MKGLVSNRVATTKKATKRQSQPKIKINQKSKSRHKRTVGNRESTGPCWLLLAVRESKTFQLLHCTAAAAAVHCSVCSALSHCVVQHDTLLHLCCVHFNTVQLSLFLSSQIRSNTLTWQNSLCFKKSNRVDVGMQ